MQYTIYQLRWQLEILKKKTVNKIIQKVFKLLVMKYGISYHIYLENVQPLSLINRYVCVCPCSFLVYNHSNSGENIVKLIFIH